VRRYRSGARDALHGTAGANHSSLLQTACRALLLVIASRWQRAGGLPTVHASTDPHDKETTMNTRTAPRLTALFSAAVVTLVMLGSMNRLATSQPSAAQWAQASAVHKA